MYLSLNLEHGDFIILIAYFLLFPLELRHTSNFALGCDFQFQTRFKMFWCQTLISTLLEENISFYLLRCIIRNNHCEKCWKMGINTILTNHRTWPNPWVHRVPKWSNLLWKPFSIGCKIFNVCLTILGHWNVIWI